MLIRVNKDAYHVYPQKNRDGRFMSMHRKKDGRFYNEIWHDSLISTKGRL